MTTAIAAIREGSVRLAAFQMLRAVNPRRDTARMSMVSESHRAVADDWSSFADCRSLATAMLPHAWLTTTTRLSQMISAIDV